MHKEGSYQKIKFNESKSKIYLLNKIENENSLVILLIENEKIIGLFIADIVEYFFSNEKLALDSIFFILKPKRKSFGAIKLLNEYFIWAESYNVKEICLSTTNGVETDKIERMYTRLGFHKAGLMYKRGK